MSPWTVNCKSTDEGEKQNIKGEKEVSLII